MFELYAQAKLETPPAGPTICGEDDLFSFVMCSNEFQTARVGWVYPGISGSSGIVTTLSSCLLNDCIVHHSLIDFFFKLALY